MHEPSQAAVPEQDERIAFLIHMGRALHSYGTPSHRLEEWLSEMSQRLDVPAQFFSMPTSIFLAFGPPEKQGISLVRVEPGEVNLSKVVRLDVVLNEVWDRKITPREGSAKVHAIVASGSPYARGLSTLCHALACAAAARFLGGGTREILVAGAIGLVIGVLARVMSSGTNRVRVFEPVAAMLATVMVFAARALVGDLETNVTTLASLIVLLPGFTLTIAMNELAVRHLMSGTARFFSAVITFMMIGFGVAVGTRIGKQFPVPIGETLVALPDWTLLLALLIAPLAFTVLFRARFRDAPVILIAGWLAFGGARLGAHLAGEAALGVAIGAFVVGVFSNLYTRVMHKPSAVPMVPGIMLLVPGSVGFKSVALLIQKDVLTGVDTAFTMAFIAISLVAGLLLANVAAPPNKIL